MKPINYPCETAIIFGDTIVPIYLQNKSDLDREMKLAVNWYRRWFATSDEAVKASLLVSFGGLYLNYNQTMGAA